MQNIQILALPASSACCGRRPVEAKLRGTRSGVSDPAPVSIVQVETYRGAAGRLEPPVTCVSTAVWCVSALRLGLEMRTWAS